MMGMKIIVQSINCLHKEYAVVRYLKPITNVYVILLFSQNAHHTS